MTGFSRRSFGRVKALRCWPARTVSAFLSYTAAALLFAGQAAASPARAVDLPPQALPPANSPPGPVAILSVPSDPYYPLAQEIAAVEGLPLAGTLEEALAGEPAFLLWVVAPGSLSDAALVRFGQALEGRRTGVSVGIISGQTLADARALWLRAGQARGEPVFAANGAYPAAGVLQGRIRGSGAGPTAAQPLSITSLQAALLQAGYLTFTGHGGSRYWKLDEGLEFTAADIPPLPASVIGTASCQTFRLWETESIALAFTRQGAAAYAGFAYSPNEGYLIGEFQGLPFRYTWPDFPLGHVVLVQNQGTLQGFARFPSYYLLGDPRLALRPAPPYQLREDHSAGELRTLAYSAAPAGLIPVRIPGGAAYTFVEIPGVASAWQNGPFYNARLQMADIGPDKFVLFSHSGGDFSLRLRPRPPLSWLAADLVADSLDHTLLYAQATGGDRLALAFAVLALLGTAWRFRRSRWPRRALLVGLPAGLLFAALHGLYAFLRVGAVTVTSKPVQPGLLPLAATFLLSGLGALLFVQAAGWPGRVLALLVAAFPALAPAVFGYSVVFLVNLAFARQALGTVLYNNALGHLASMAVLIELGLYGAVFSGLRKAAQAAGTKSGAAFLPDHP